MAAPAPPVRVAVLRGEKDEAPVAPVSGCRIAVYRSVDELAKDLADGPPALVIVIGEAHDGIPHLRAHPKLGTATIVCLPKWDANVPARLAAAPATAPARWKARGVIAAAAVLVVAGLLTTLWPRTRAVLEFARGPVARVGDRVLLGPCPTEGELEHLRSLGVRRVICVMDPASAVEGPLVAQVRAACGRLGLEFQSEPMVAELAPNAQALDRISELVRNDAGPTYIHGNLGRHRVHFVGQRLLRDLGLPVRPAPVHLPKRFERGELTTITDLAITGPYPTDEEFQALAEGGIVKIVTLLSDADVEEATWLAREREQAKKWGLALEVVPVPRGSRPDAEHIARCVAAFQASRAGLYVHDFHGNERVRYVAAALRHHAAAPRSE